MKNNEANDLLNEFPEDEISEKDLLQDDTAEEEENVESGTVNLKKPLMVEGDKISKIDYDFSVIKPIQYINLIKRTQKKEGTISLPELNQTIQLGMFALASGISMGDLKRIEYLPDYTKLCRAARDFLLQDSEETENQ